MSLAVLDASVGVKWFRDEEGSARARRLLTEHGAGSVTLVVPSLFVYEVVGVASRSMSGEQVEEFWSRFVSWGLHVRQLDPELVQASLDLRAEFACAFYDSVSPALARLLGAPLYSADRRAHARMENVVLLGG